MEGLQCQTEELLFYLLAGRNSVCSLFSEQENDAIRVDYEALSSWQRCAEWIRKSVLQHRNWLAYVNTFQPAVALRSLVEEKFGVRDNAQN